MKAIPVRLTTPYPPGHVTGYLLPSKPVTVVDPGPALPTTLPRWERAFAASGLRPGQIEQIVLTHQHWDHIGAAATLRQETGARVLAVAGVRPFVTGYAAALAAEVAVYVEAMRLHGMPADVEQQALEMFAALPGYVVQADLDGVLVDGAPLLAGGRELVVLARPGHSPTDTILLDPDTRVALVGDHLLADLPPIFMPPVPAAGPIQSGQTILIDSLRRTAELDLARALPAHGGPVADVAGTVARWLRFYRRRDERVLAALAGRPRGAWELTCAVEGEIRRGHGLFKLIAMLGSLELLEADGRVLRGEDGAGRPQFGLS